MGTVQLEFLYLAHATKNPSYATPALKVFQHIDRIGKPNGCMGLHSLYLNLGSGEFSGGRWSMGALGDSFYEYLLKVCVKKHLFFNFNISVCVVCEIIDILYRISGVDS